MRYGPITVLVIVLLAGVAIAQEQPAQEEKNVAEMEARIEKLESIVLELAKRIAILEGQKGAELASGKHQYNRKTGEWRLSLKDNVGKSGALAEEGGRKIRRSTRPGIFYANGTNIPLEKGRYAVYVTVRVNARAEKSNLEISVYRETPSGKNFPKIASTEIDARKMSSTEYKTCYLTFELEEGRKVRVLLTQRGVSNYFVSQVRIRKR